MEISSILSDTLFSNTPTSSSFYCPPIFGGFGNSTGTSASSFYRGNLLNQSRRFDEQDEYKDCMFLNGKDDKDLREDADDMELLLAAVIKECLNE